MAQSRKRKPSSPAASAKPAPVKRRTTLWTSIWLQCAAMFIVGIGFGAFIVGPGVADTIMLQDDALPPPAFGGLPGETAPVVAASSASLSVAAVAENPDALLRSQIEFKHVAHDIVGGTKEAGYLAVTDREQLNKLWAEMAARGGRLQSNAGMNLDGRVLLTVFAGEKPTAAHRIEVSHIVMTEKEVRVNVLETSPGAGCNAVQTVTSPYHMVFFERVDLPIVVIRETQAIDC